MNCTTWKWTWYLAYVYITHKQDSIGWRRFTTLARMQTPQKVWEFTILELYYYYIGKNKPWNALLKNNF